MSTLRRAVLVGATVILFGGLSVLYYFHFEECRRYHPFWYCLFDR